MMILAEEEEGVLLGLCVVVVSLAFLFANALVFDGYLTSRGSGRGCASASR
jgi:hypothetical protein